MRKTIAPQLAVMLAVLVLSPGAAGAQPAEAQPAEADAASRCDALPPDLGRICSNGRLRVARYGGQRPPFFFHAGDGRWRGFDVELAANIARQLEVAVETTLAASFDEVVDLVAAGDADVAISKLSITLDRSQRVRFSKPYITVYQTLLINRRSAPRQQDPFVTLNRPRARIGALDGSSYIGYAESELSAAEVVPRGDLAQMMTDVAEGRLDAAYVDSAQADTWRRDNPERLIQVRAFVARDRRDFLAFAVNWRDTHLLAWLDLYLDQIRDDGAAERLYSKWFGAAAEANPGEFRR